MYETKDDSRCGPQCGPGHFEMMLYHKFESARLPNDMSEYYYIKLNELNENLTKNQKIERQLSVATPAQPLPQTGLSICFHWCAIILMNVVQQAIEEGP